MTPLDRLLDWHGSWTLTGNVITSRKCGAGQSDADRESAFPHTSKCLPLNSDDSPWRALDEIQVAFQKYSER